MRCDLRIEIKKLINHATFSFFSSVKINENRKKMLNS